MYKKILIISAILLLIIITVYSKTSLTPPKKTPVISPIASPMPSIPNEAILYFSPDTITSNRGQDNETNIQIKTQGNPPTLLQFELAYDPSALSEITLFPGDIFPKSDMLLNENDEKTGRISFAFSLPTDINPRYASGNTAKLKFKVNKFTTQTQTTIYFLPKTSILAGTTTIPLKIAYGLKIIINQKYLIPSISTVPK